MATAGDLLKELKHVLYESPYDGFWTDSMLLGYMSEGQDRFCEDTGYFVDPTAYSFPTVVDVQSYAISPRIIRVMDVYDAGRALRRYEEQSKDSWQDPPLIQYQPNNQQLRGFQTDFAPGYVTLWPVPVDVRTLTMRVWRYPLKPLCEQGLNTGVEIPIQFARGIIEYAAYKAYSHHDQELQDTLKASDHFLAYQYYVDRGEESFRRLRGSETRVGPSPVYVV